MTIHATWLNTLDYLENAKILAVYFVLTTASLIPILSFRQIRLSKPARILRLYGAIMAVLCIFAPTASLLWRYSAAHNTYPRIWAMVPILPLSALLLTESVLLLYQKGKSGAIPKIRCVLAMVLSLFILLLCGNFGTTSENESSDSLNDPELILAEARLSELCYSEDLIYAPRSLTAFLHRTETAHRTLYGRDMWDTSVDGFQYDTYSEDVIELFDLMYEIEFYSVSAISGDNIKKGILCCNAAKDADVTVLVFPRWNDSTDEAMQELANEASMTLTVSDSEESASAGYYLLIR